MKNNKKDFKKCKRGYGYHDFCVINTNTNKISCCNCGLEKIGTIIPNDVLKSPLESIY